LQIDFRLQIADFCREIETYLCRKNDGHLIRVTGPSFDLVAGWAAQGVPLKVAFEGIDRYFERYYAKGPRRRPVKIDFCEADVLDVFDEWRRATGVTAVRDGLKTVPYRNDESTATASVGDGLQAVPHPTKPSLPRHLERVVSRLTAARASNVLGSSFDELIDRVAAELDAASAETRGLRGDARRALIDRLAIIDAELLQKAREMLDAPVRDALAREADVELAPFRSGMTPEALARARQAAIDRLVRERFGLPTVTLG
jgi:hypothetical protein